MFEKLERKLVNVLLFFDLFKMKTKIPKDFTKVMRIQDKRVRKLVKKAYKIPFYKERFDRAGVRPEDIRTGDDLSKLPLLTKDELRAWMNEEAKNPKYEDWYHDTTSGSSGVPLMLLVSPREKAYNMANWFRVMMTAGYNPFFGKTMSRKSAHSVTGGSDTFLQHFGILRRGFVAQYDPEPEIVKQINAYRPDFLYMNKSEFMRICLYCKKNHVKLAKPKFYCPTGEKIDDTARKLFAEILGPGIIDSYGTAETGAAMVRLFDSTVNRQMYLTGGIMLGCTSTMATSPSGKFSLYTIKAGCGRMFPSDLSPARLRKSSSVTCIPLREPSSFAPINRYPGKLLLRMSLANAHTACANLSVFVVETVRSTRSFSMSLSNLRISVFVSISISFYAKIREISLSAIFIFTSVIQD